MALNIRTESTLAVGLLLFLQVVTAASAIILLSRMAPALEQVLQENDYSIQAAEEMLTVLALIRDADPERGEDLTQRFLDALERASANITEPDEQPVIEEITRLHLPALGGDANARGALIEALSKLSAINRATVHRADQRAQRLGRAGAWAAFALALLTSILSVVAMRRAHLRLVEPLLDMHDIAKAFQQGDMLRRCRKPSPSAPVELADISDGLNRLLDDRLQRPQTPNNPPPDPQADSQTETRAALLYLIDRLPDAVCLLNAQGQVLAANTQGMDLLSCAHGAPLREAFTKNPGQAVAVEQLSITPTQIRDGLWLCSLSYAL